ncbi:Macrolide export protein MacA [Pelotomaculum schinkii]|uniref:Macrolide export protein MacA n=1 Tax=Pelotomaculum schinkii TaxID=78350 RepID=A0A4Y7RJS0_9FIRM|nr:efflux RND transporter periplasmic adaptor subunit [Pelotomaculum schinkii]TEB08577.1 Macrolide export protein MacA [Pelotomaculum schinkii]
MENTLNHGIKKFSLPPVFYKRKKLLGVLIIVVIALAGYFLLGNSKKASGGYLTENVKKGSITNTISASGTVEPVSTVSLSFKNAEIIKNIYVKVGDHVTPGQVLADQDSENLELSVTQAVASVDQSSASLELLQQGSTQEELREAEASVQIAQASYDQAKSNLERNQKLAEAEALSQTDLETYQASYANAEGNLIKAQEAYKALLSGSKAEDIKSAEAKLASSQAQLQAARIDLTGATMTSPINGIVSEINGAVGQRATANNNSTSGSSGFMVVISEALQVTAQVNEADIGKTQVGQKVEFTVNSFPNTTFTGQISSVAPQAYTSSNVQLYDVIIQIDDNQQGLKAGMPADVTIIVERQENTLIISKAAVTYAANYLNTLGQSGAAKPANIEGGNSQIQNNKQTSGAGAGAASGSSSSNGAAGAATSSKDQQSTILVMGQSGQPEPRQVTLGMSDLSNYEVVNGLNEGETVVVGSLSQTSTSTSTSTSNSSTRSNQGGGMMGGGPPPGGP